MKASDLKDKELIMMVGIPGTGKSTYINKIKAQNPDKDYVIIGVDNILDDLAAEKGLTYAQSFQKHAGFAGKEIFRQAKIAIEQGRNIIWDQTNLTPKARAKKLNMMPENYLKKAVVFVVSDQEIQRRLVKREEETGKTIPPHVLKSMARSYQAPTKAEFDEIEYIR